MSALLDHLEKTAADNYRKEIDQEENVWRTLPFFVAALAVEIAAVTQVKDQIRSLAGVMAVTAAGIGMVAFVCAFAAVIFLVRSIFWADFKYVSREPELLRFAEQLQEAEEQDDIPAGSGVEHFKRLLARQYSACTDNNRVVNQHRVRMRTTAGIVTLFSLVASLMLVALTLTGPSVLVFWEGRNVGTEAGSGGHGAQAAGQGGVASQGASVAGRSEGPVHPSGDK